MAWQSLALFGLCLVFAISAQSIDEHCEGEECTSVPTDPARGPVLLQARNTRKIRAIRSRRGNSTKRHSRRSSKRRNAGHDHDDDDDDHDDDHDDNHDDGHGDWGGCADTNGEARYGPKGDELSCLDYEPPYQEYCDEADDDFSAQDMCCTCGGGGPVPDPFGLGLQKRAEVCDGKKVGDECEILNNVPDTNDKTHLQSQCSADHDEDGHVVLACTPVFKLRHFGHIEDTCKDEDGDVPDGTLCGRLFMNKLTLPGGFGYKETYRLCTCQGGTCPHCSPGKVDPEDLPELHEHEHDHEHSD